MQRIARRDEQAFVELYERYAPRMHRYFYRMLWRDASRAEDFTQELFLKIIEKPHLFDSSRSFRTWIYAMAANMCKNEFRRKKPEGPEYPEPPLASDRSAEELDRPAFEAALRGAIDRLNDAQRQCFVLRYQEELPVAEIAAILDCPEGTVKSRLHYALQQISERMILFKPGV